MSRRVPYAARAARERLFATDAQKIYLRRLLHQAFARVVHHDLRLDPNHLDDVTKAYASESIAHLKALLEARNA